MHTQLNAGRPKEAIDVLLLDERYHRVPMPCHTRHRYCTDHSIHKGHNRKVRGRCGPDTGSVGCVLSAETRARRRFTMSPMW